MSDGRNLFRSLKFFDRIYRRSYWVAIIFKQAVDVLVNFFSRRIILCGTRDDVFRGLRLRVVLRIFGRRFRKELSSCCFVRAAGVRLLIIFLEKTQSIVH